MNEPLTDEQIWGLPAETDDRPEAVCPYFDRPCIYWDVLDACEPARCVRDDVERC
jgi:hypothetical protein